MSLLKVLLIASQRDAEEAILMCAIEYNAFFSCSGLFYLHPMPYNRGNFLHRLNALPEKNRLGERKPSKLLKQGEFMTDNLIGTIVGGYEIQSQIGQGGMATVYRAQQISMNRVVALKMLPRQFLNDDTYLQRFNQEVKIVSQLEHRNIVPVHDYGQHNGQPYIVMRYMPAGSVDDLIQRKGALAMEVILPIIEQVAAALDYAHSKNVLHRDLKPSNVLLDNDGGAFITDFGIARILGEQAPGITTQGVVGTPSYMSPEQAQAHPLDSRSDVYSVGIMLFEMATGRRPFESDTPYSIAVMQVTAAPPSPRSFNGNVPVRVEQVILKALKKNREERFATAAELAEALRVAIEGPEPLPDTQPHPIHPLPQPLQAPPQPYMPPLYAQVTPPSVHVVSVSQPRAEPSWGGRAKRRERGSIWLSVTLGGLIGCALLTVIVVVGAIIINTITGGRTTNETPVVTQPVSNDPGESGVPTLDSTSETARLTLLPSTPTPGNEAASATLAVGVRSTATFSPLLSQARGSILYFGPDSDSDEIMLLELASRVRTQLTADTEGFINSYPSASWDGQRIVFQSNRDGDFEIYVVNRGGGQLRKLTDNTVLDRLASWSPDGAWIVYSSDVRGDGNFDLYRVPSEGGEPELVFSNGQRNSHARYSPDGRHLVFTSGQARNANTWEILKLDTQTGETTQLTTNGYRDASPLFSPDGSHILFITRGEGNAAIARMNLDGSDVRIIYDSPGFEWAASYSPDSNYIVFNNDVTGRDEVYIMTADGVEAQMITDQGAAYPSWLP